jgi:hypothetical protein
MCSMVLLLIHMVFFQEIHVYFQLIRISLFGIKWTFLHLENLICRKYSFQKLTQFSQGNNVLDSPPSNIHGFFGEIHVVLQLNWIGLFRSKWGILPLKTLIGRKYAFLKFNQFSQGSNVLDIPISKLDGFLSRSTCVSSTQLNRSIWNKLSFSTPWKPWCTGSIPFKNLLSSHRETMC